MAAYLLEEKVKTQSGGINVPYLEGLTGEAPSPLQAMVNPSAKWYS